MALALVRPDTLCAWKGPSLVIVNTRGECGSDQALSGYYFREARLLSTMRLEIDGDAPWLCEAASIDPTCLMFNFVYPEITQPGGGGTGQSGDEEATNARGLPERSLDLRVSMQLEVGGMTITVEIANRARRDLECEVAWQFAADFADIQEAQSGHREQEAAVDTAERDGCLEFAYRHPALPYRTEIRHDDARWRVQGGRIAARIALKPQKAEVLRLRVVAATGTRDLTDEGIRDREAAVARWRDGFARVEIPGSVAEDILSRNVRDIASFPMLDGPADEWLAMQAGMPAYPAFFGRDGVTAGWQSASLDRGQSLAAAMTKLRRLQSDRVFDWRDEQPGRIPYQVRGGPLALLDLNPYAAYYADYASPLMFVISLANLWAWTGDRQCLDENWDAVRRILDWARDDGDADRDGYLEYRTRSSKGTKNQGWKDSGDAITYDDGSPVPSPIATCELQAYWYIAQELMALMCWVKGARDDARAYRESASALKKRFNRDWWVEAEQFYALALDPEKRRVDAVTSNVGHCLACGIIDSDRLPAVVGRMFAPDLFSGWGVRTLSTHHAYYNPLSYHRGSVWAVEQATIVFGLRRFGFDARAADVTQALFDLARLYPEHRVPECIGGYARSERPVPGAYPRTNTPQLWNATAFPLVLQTMLGLLPVAAAGTLVIDPALPPWIPELVLRGLRVGDATVSLRFWRDADGASKWDVLHRQGTINVIRQPAPESRSARWTDRAKAVFESILA